MSDPIRFFVDGDPKGQPRPRAFARRMGNRYVARVFDAGTAENWKSRIAVVAKPHAPLEPMVGPIAVELCFQLARPKAHFRAGRFERGLRDDAPQWVTAKPDADNLAKAVLDALTQLGSYWRDDSQVAELVVRKGYSTMQGCTVSISTLGNK